MEHSFITLAEALRDIRGYAAAGRVRFSYHAYDRMDQRGATERDVIAACARAKKCKRAAQGRWKVTGPDIDSDDLTVVVAIEDGLLVVTLF
jgi:hypothetical protein